MPANLGSVHRQSDFPLRLLRPERWAPLDAGERTHTHNIIIYLFAHTAHRGGTTGRWGRTHIISSYTYVYDNIIIHLYAHRAHRGGSTGRCGAHTHIISSYSYLRTGHTDSGHTAPWPPFALTSNLRVVHRQPDFLLRLLRSDHCALLDTGGSHTHIMEHIISSYT